jgi:hypothetical protein
MRALIQIILISLSACIVTLAQGQKLDEATYNERIKKATEFRVTTPYRETQVSDASKANDGNWRPMLNVVTDVMSPGRRHVWITKTGLGENTPSTEFIFVDGKTYAKRLNIGWKLEPSSLGSELLVQRAEPLGFEYRDLGKEIFDDRDVRVLWKTARFRLTINGEISDNVQTIKSWIDSTGRLIKEERLSVNSKIGATRMTFVYEIDPSIRVEAPIK